MMQIASYNVIDVIAESKTTLLCRALDLETNESILLKMNIDDYPSSQNKEKLAWEYTITRELNSLGIVKPLRMEKFKHRDILVFEDFGGVSLQNLMPMFPTDIHLFFQVALPLVDILDGLHNNNVIHTNINPLNIIVNIPKQLVKLTNFELAVKVTNREHPIEPVMMEGLLSHISPEQTGRMNRKVDFRSDFYALGVTFYEMLTGQLPFQVTDPYELILCHLAANPTHPKTINPSIPGSLAHIILKCLSKNPEDRYQSSYGLKKDLIRCVQSLTDDHQIDDFVIGEHDKLSQLRISDRLFGREKELSILLESFKQVSYGNSAYVWISGDSGMGKSHLVLEAQMQFMSENSICIQSKSESSKSQSPYYAIAQAFGSFIRMLMTTNESNIREWKEKILEAVKINGQLLIEVIPELEWIIGPQLPVNNMHGEERKSRFQWTMKRFIKLFAGLKTPLVIFLDDLQWVDSGSLQVIEMLLTEFEFDDHPYLFIGNFRDNEVPADHPLRQQIEHSNRHKQHVVELQLHPLTSAHISELLADTLRCSPDTCHELGKLILSKTKGNPYYVKQFLSMIHERGFIYFSDELNQWQWDISKIQIEPITDNVPLLLTKWAQVLPPSTMELLKAASCIGEKFKLDTLVLLFNNDIQDMIDWIYPAIEAEFVAANVPAHSSNPSLEFEFTHDRVLQFINDIMNEQERKNYHFQIANIMLEEYQHHPADDVLFPVVRHFNHSLDLITNTEAIPRIAKLYIEAGRKAKKMIAPEMALSYLHTANLLFDDAAGPDHTELIFTIQFEIAEAYFLMGNHALSERHLSQLLGNPMPPLKKADIYNLAAMIHMVKGDHEQSVYACVQGLNQLKQPFPAKAGSLAILVDLLKIKLRLGTKKPQDLYTMPDVSDPSHLMAIKLFATLNTPSYLLIPV